MSREIQIGDRIRDNDPRMPNRILKIVGIFESRVAVRDWTGKLFRIQLRRIYTDGKARKSGFSLTEKQS